MPTTEPAGDLPADCIMHPASREHMRCGSLVFFLSGCACRAVCCPVLPRAGLHVLSSVSICVSIRMHMSIYICISQCVQVPTGSRAGGDERGLQLMVTLQGCAEAMKGEGFDSCNQPCFAKILPAAQGGRLLQAAGRSIPTGLSSAPCARGLEARVPGARKGGGFRVCQAP